MTPDTTPAGLREAMDETLRVLVAAHALTGDLEMAITWFRTQTIAELGDFTPMGLVEMGKAQSVVDYIKSISSGHLG
jgi:hypothetical protein